MQLGRLSQPTQTISTRMKLYANAILCGRLFCCLAAFLALGIIAKAEWTTVDTKYLSTSTFGMTSNFTVTMVIQVNGDRWRGLYTVTNLGGLENPTEDGPYSSRQIRLEVDDAWHNLDVVSGGETIAPLTGIMGGATNHTYDNTEHFCDITIGVGLGDFEAQDTDSVTLPTPVTAYEGTYGITFHLPANEGERAILYIATQAGLSIASIIRKSGDPAVDWYVGSIIANTPIDLQIVVGGFVSLENGVHGIVPPDNSFGHPPTETVVVVDDAIPSEETEPNEGATAEATPTMTGGTSGVAGGGYEPIAPQPAPTHPGLTSPSGTGGATKADIETVGNQITSAVNSADTRNIEGINRMLQGVNAVLKATEYQTAIVQAIAREQALRDSARDEILERIASGAESPEQAAARAATANSAAAAGASAGTAIAGQYNSVGGTHTGLSYTVGEGTEPSLAVTMPAEFGGKTFDLNPFTQDRFGPIASWFRSAVAWLVVITIGAWVWNELDVKAYQAGTAQQAKGNAVAGGTGAQFTALTAAAALTTAIVALTTALLGWTFGEITLPNVVTALGTNPTTSLPAGVLWMLNQLLPVALIITACVARLAWKMYSVPLFATCMAVCRFIVP